MNLAMRGIDGHIPHGDAFPTDRFPNLKANITFANRAFATGANA